MAVGDILSTPTDLINSKEFRIKARLEQATNLNNPAIAREYPHVIAQLNEMKKMPRFAKYNTPDELMDAIFGAKGIDLSASIIDSPITTTSGGDLIDLTPTITGRFIGATNLTNTQILNFEVQMVTTSYMSEFFIICRDFLSSMPTWSLHIERNTAYTGLRDANPDLAQGVGLNYKATADLYDRSRSSEARLDLSNKLIVGKLTGVDTGPRITVGTVSTGTLSFKGAFAATYNPVVVTT